MKININVLKEWTENTIDIDLLLNDLTLIGFETCLENDNINVLIPHNRLNSTNLFSILYEFSKVSDFNRKKICLEKHSYKNNIEIKIHEKTFCPLYNGIIIHNINNKIAIPLYIKNMLYDNGINFNLPIVDILNYATLIFGQPFHAYDLNKISKNINITKTSKTEQVLLLNNNIITLDKNTFVVCDSVNIIAIPGVIGSHSSKIDEETTSIFLESAFFLSECVTDLSKRLNIQTRASELFKNCVNPQLTQLALVYATNLLMNILNASCSNIVEKKYCNYFPKDNIVNLRKKNVSIFIGYNLDQYVLKNCLLKLKFNIKNFKTHWKIKIPIHRTDIISEENIIAEILKIYGFNNIKEKSITTVTNYEIDNYKELVCLKKMASLLVDRGFFEIINYSFVDSDIEKKLHLNDKFIYLKNPISKNLDVMRSNLIQGLLKTAALNFNRYHNQVNLFEKGNVFFYEDKKIVTRRSLSAVYSNNDIFLNKKNYKHINFFILKNLVEEIFYIINSEVKLRFQKDKINYLNHDVSASIFINDKKIGLLGLVNNEALDIFSIKKPLYFFCVDLQTENVLEQKNFQKISKYPNIRRDLSIVCNENIVYETIVTHIYDLKIKILYNIELLNIFSFEEKNTKSITLRLTFQSFEQTLLDDNVNSILDDIQKNLRNKFDVIIRTAN